MTFYRYVIYDSVAKAYLWNISRSNKKAIQEIIEVRQKMYGEFVENCSRPYMKINKNKWQKELDRVNKYEIVKMKIERINE